MSSNSLLTPVLVLPNGERWAKETDTARWVQAGTEWGRSYARLEKVPVGIFFSNRVALLRATHYANAQACPPDQWCVVDLESDTCSKPMSRMDAEVVYNAIVATMAGVTAARMEDIVVDTADIKDLSISTIKDRPNSIEAKWLEPELELEPVDPADALNLELASIIESDPEEGAWG